MKHANRPSTDRPAPVEARRAGFDWLSAVAGALFGVIAGYLIAGGRPASVVPASAPNASAPGAAAPAGNDAQIQTYHDIVAQNPKNVTAQIQLANLLYDSGKYEQSVGHYEKAFALDPKNVNVSTDLGTALWYTGKADAALAQFEKSLAIQPDHPQTLFNVGIVKRDGKNDKAGAIAAWERLLAANPTYTEAAKIRQLIDEAKRGG